jgi:hypothetical protein
MWTRLQNLPRYLRWPIKWAVVAVTVFLVCFPNPALFVRHVQHWRDPNAMIDPDLPELQPLVAQVKGVLDPDMQPRAALKAVEKFVYEQVPYQFDWVTWGAADYLPTLEEVLAVGFEDCDGQAVVAASLLCNLGYRAELVTDFAHVWVKTDKGETMSPGKRKSIVATEKGLWVDWQAVTRTLPRSLAYSVSPFPLLRELIILGVVWLTLVRPGVGRLLPLVCLLVMFSGLLCLRAGGADWRHPDISLQLLGGAQLVAGVVALAFLGRRAARAVAATEPETEPAG